MNESEDQTSKNLPQSARRSVMILQPYIPAYRDKFFRELIRRAGLAGIDVTIAAGQPHGDQAKRNDDILPDYALRLSQWDFRFLGRKVTVRQLPAVARAADLIVMEQARRNLDIYRLFLPKWLRSQPVALWGHGSDHAGSKSSIDRALRVALTKRSDWFFAYTAPGVTSVYEQGLAVGRATNLQNSTDTSDLRKRLARFRKDSSGTSQRSTYCTAAYVGALDTGKRIDLLIASGAEIAKRLPRFKLLVAGSGPAMPMVQEAAQHYEWLEYVGIVSGEEKARLLGSAEVLLVPGSIGLVAVDALAAGLPVVTTSNNAHGPEFSYLEQGRTSVVSEPTVSSYTEAVVSLVTDRARLALMQRCCSDDGAKFSVENMAENFLQGLRSFFESKENVRGD